MVLDRSLLPDTFCGHTLPSTAPRPGTDSHGDLPGLPTDSHAKFARSMQQCLFELLSVCQKRIAAYRACIQYEGGLKKIIDRQQRIFDMFMGLPI